MKYINPFSSFIIVFFLHFLVLAQVKDIGIPKIKNFKRTEYKGGTQNWDIDQDQNGNMFFANNSGLIHFDGTNWHQYSLPNNSPIRSLKIDKNGTIFVGGNDEFGYFKSDRKGKLVYFSLSKWIPKKKKSNINLIWRIHFYKGEVVFQSFTKCFFFKNNKLRFFDAPSNFQFSFIVNHKLYFQDKKLGVLEFKNNKLIPLPGTTVLNNVEIWDMFLLPNNKILMATLEKGLFIYENTRVKPWNTEANAFIQKHTSLGGTILKDKFIVLNSVLNGILICDLNGKIIQHLNHQKGLLNNTILTSFVDKKGNLWLGLDNGITFINENSPLTYFDYSFNLGTVYATLVHDGYLYVATNQGLFYHSWNQSNKNEPFKKVDGVTAQVWNINVFNNTLLCASNDGALIVKQNKVIRKLDDNGYFGFKTIPNNKQYIIGESYDGFSIFKETNNGIEFINRIENINEISNTFDVELDENYLWQLKNNQLIQMTLSADLKKINSIKKYPNVSKYKGIGSIQKIDNKVYFQIQNHFYRYSTEQAIFFEDKKWSQLFKTIAPITSLKQDVYGNIWYTYNEAIGMLKKEKNGTYSKNEASFANLNGNLVNKFVSIYTVDPSNIFIGLTDGLAHYDSEIPNNNSSKPNAYIESFSFANDTLFKANLSPSSQKTSIPFRDNNVKFKFSSTPYENQENIKYSYKLEPFEDNWSNWSVSTLKEYTNLREGNYTMKLKTKNSYGIVSTTAEMHFAICAPWYRHPVAYLMYLLLLLASFYLVYHRMKIKIRRNKYYETIEQRRIYLEKESKIRNEQFELEKEIERLKNDKLKIKILSKDKELVNNSLQVVKKNKILNGIISKLKNIDTTKLDETTKFEFNKLHKSIVKEVNADKSWKDLEKHLKNVHFDFLKKLKEKHPTISPREMDLSTYLLMNMSTKEIAEFMNISTAGVELARYRLRKKIGLHQKENLIGYLMSI